MQVSEQATAQPQRSAFSNEPAKRRLLNDEGVLFSPLSPKSPDKSMRSEYLSLGLLSPRRLDFERVEMEMKTPSEAEVHKVQTPSTPRAQRIAGHPRKLAPSPELVSSPPSAKRLDEANISSDLPRGRSTSPSLPLPSTRSSRSPGLLRSAIDALPGL